MKIQTWKQPQTQFHRSNLVLHRQKNQSTTQTLHGIVQNWVGESTEREGDFENFNMLNHALMMKGIQCSSRKVTGAIGRRAHCSVARQREQLWRPL
jgi:hypothetical protein